MEMAAQDDGLFLNNPNDAMRAAGYARLRELGITWLRANVWWGRTDASPESLATVDRLIAEAHAHGLHVQITLAAGSADWTGGKGINPNPAVYAQWVSVMVRRFSAQGVHRYSIWNEPNLPHDTFMRVTGGPKAVARLYGALFEHGSRAVRAADPHAQVFIGELAGFSHTWLYNALRGRRLVADGFAMHPYQFKISPRKKGSEGGIGNLRYIQRFLKALHRHGLLRTPAGGVVPLYLTEFGYVRTQDRTLFQSSTLGSSSKSGFPDEKKRALWAAQAVDVARRAGARQLLFYQLMQVPPTTSWDTSLLTMAGDGSSVPLPIFSALAAKLNK